MVQKYYPRVKALAVAASFLAGAVQAQQNDGNNTILYPDSANLAYNYLDTVDVALTTDYDTPYLYWFCWDSSGILQEILYYSPSDVEGRSEVPVKLKTVTEYMGTTCWFNLLNAVSGSNTTDGATSSEFSYVKEEADQKTFSLSSTSTSSVTSSTPTSTANSGTAISITPTSTASSSTATTPSDTASSSSGGGLSTGAQAGIGVAVALVGLAIIGATIWLFLRRRRQSRSSPVTKTEGSEPEDYVAEEKKAPVEIAGLERQELPITSPPSEMEAQWQHLVFHELESPADRR